MECKRAAQLISDGVLDKGGVELAELREHAAHCGACLTELRAYELLLSEVSVMNGYAVPSNLRASIMSAIASKPVSCNTVQSLLSASFDNELSWSDSDKVHTHIGNCKHCASDVDSIGLVAMGVHDLEVVLPPERVRTQILYKVHKSENTVSIADWFTGKRRSWGLGLATSATVLCALVYINIMSIQQPAVSPTIYLGSRSMVAPPTLGKLPGIPQDKSPEAVLAAKEATKQFVIVSHRYLGPISQTLSASDTSSLRVAYNHRSLNTAKAVSALFKKNKAVKQTVDTKDYSVIPDVSEVKYNLEEHEPINLKSEPEVVASVAGTNVNSEYAGDKQYFTKVAEKVQNKNRLDEWLEKSKSYTEEAKLSRKSANIQLIGFKF